MSNKKKKRANGTRDKPSYNDFFLCGADEFATLACSGYTRLIDNPEIKSAVNKIADLVSSMTIHLMQNGKEGDVRVKNGLSQKIDIYPNKRMTRKTFISAIVRSLLLEGDGNAVCFVETKNGLIENIIPLPPTSYTFSSYSYLNYSILWNGSVFDPDDMLHFVINPDVEYPWKGTGYRVQLKQVANNLKQARETEKGFMESKWKPSIIVKVDAQAEELSDQEGRKKLAEQYLGQDRAGAPWIIPTDFMDVTTIKPLTLQDLAINDTIKLDKQTVASILDVPAFILGVGSFSKEEWNNWINTKIFSFAQTIEQELTRKLLISPEMYFKCNSRSLYAYDLKELSDIGSNMYVRGLMLGNEARDWIGLSPLDGLSERVILENYIPAGMIGDQKKLIQKEGDENG